MSLRTLYAYLEDPDPPGAAEALLDHARFFLGEQAWQRARPFLVDQPLVELRPRRPGEPTERDVGLHVLLPPPEALDDGWQDDLGALLSYLQRARLELGLSFVLGVFDRDGRYAEDLAFLDRSEPDLARLAEALGIPLGDDAPTPVPGRALGRAPAGVSAPSTSRGRPCRG